jgi:predicted DNA-binding protein (MmcQ/YjbR family)
VNIEKVAEFCLSKEGATESFPFGDSALVVKVGEKIFAILNLDSNSWINLKCDPERAIELRETNHAISPGYHMNKNHWNTIQLEGSLPDKLLREMIDHSYDLVYQSLPAQLKLKVSRKSLK